MDAFAQGLKAAHRLIDEGEVEAIVSERYASWTTGIGKSITDGKEDFESLEKYVIDKPQITNIPGRQERLDALVSRAIFES